MQFSVFKATMWFNETQFNNNMIPLAFFSDVFQLTSLQKLAELLCEE